MKKKFKISKKNKVSSMSSYERSENRKDNKRNQSVYFTDDRLNLMADKLRDKNYSTFLKSLYWDTVRVLVFKRMGKRCTKCKHTYGLHVHHRTYKNHFREHLHLSDLTVLCKKCHDKVHGFN